MALMDMQRARRDRTARYSTAHADRRPPPRRGAARRRRPFDGSCWHTLDPATGLMTDAFTDSWDPRWFPEVCRIEYCEGDVNPLHELADQPP